MKFNNLLPQSLPKECEKAAKIFNSFVDSGNNGLDGVIPRTVLENAKGFAIFTLVKAGFVLSARAGGGIVIARLDNGGWSAPSAIGLAGMGFGGQAGAEVTDFLIVLNSRSAVRSFMAAGSLTLGGNMSLAIGPLGRNGEANGTVNSDGKLAAMYSYSKTRGLFGGVSIEGSIIVERQDANAQAYRSDVTVKQLLSGSISPPEWANSLIQTLDACTGMPGGRKWVSDTPNTPTTPTGEYAFGGIGSSGSTKPNSFRSNKSKNSFPPLNWGQRKDSGSYFGPESSSGYAAGPSAASPFDDDFDSTSPSKRPSKAQPGRESNGFGTLFESDFVSETRPPRARLSYISAGKTLSPPGSSESVPRAAANVHARSFSTAALEGRQSYSSQNVSGQNGHSRNVFTPSTDEDDPFGFGLGKGTASDSTRVPTGNPKLAAKKELIAPMPVGGVARAIALFDFNAVQVGDLSFKKGQVITITEKSGDTNTWWKGMLDGREGIFPANFVEVV